jgi:hypothetical protein
VASRPLIKKLTYRDVLGRSQAEHAAHWAGFQWQAGSVVCSCVGPWGEVQCWASSEQEGRRVLSHALIFGGWDLDSIGVEWLFAVASGERNGRSATMRTKATPLGVEVTRRVGPSGFPTIS